MQQKVYCASAAGDVYRAISTVLGRERFWAESAPESGGTIAFVLADGRADRSPVEEAVVDRRYRLRYFGRRLTFTLVPADPGTEVVLDFDDPPDAPEFVSLLLRLKASVDFGVDLRNHDPARSTAYADS